MVTSLYSACHAEHSATMRCPPEECKSAESKDPDSVSYTMQRQRILWRAS
jgi:hypothetical protein